MAIYRWMGKKFSDQERATIARGWTASGLPQDQYAASYGVTGRALRGWMAKFAPSAPPLERVEYVLVGMMQKLQTMLDGVRAERTALELRAEGRASSSAPLPHTTDVFRQERRPEAPQPRTEPAEHAPPVRRRRGSFFQEFGSD